MHGSNRIPREHEMLLAGEHVPVSPFDDHAAHITAHVDFAGAAASCGNATLYERIAGHLVKHKHMNAVSEKMLDS